MSQDKTILEFERTLIATMINRPADCWRVDVLPEHFVSEQHGEIVAAIREQTADSQPVDAVTLCDVFERGDRRALARLVMDIAANGTTTAVPDAYGQRIVAGWRQRMAREIGISLAESKDPASVDSAIERLMALHASEQQHEFSSKQAARSAFEELHRVHAAGGKLPGVTTGLADVDDKLGGLHPGDLIVVGGRAAMGKTAFLLGMAASAAASGAPVGIISGEQPVQQVALRMVSAQSRLAAKTFRTADFDEGEWARVFSGFDKLAELPLWVLDRSAPTLAEVARTARRWIHQHGIKALYVDYLQRIVGEGERKFEQVGYVARGLKNLARDLGIPVVVLAQVSRAVETRSSQVPRMGDLSDSSEIEKEADQILMLYREGYYRDEAPQGVARVIVEKNRHGPTGYIDVAWHGETMTFADLAREQYA